MCNVLANLVIVFVGGSLGSVARYSLSSRIAERSQARLPVGTLTVNLIGALLIGVISYQAHHLGAHGVLFADIGFVGAFTTFSSLSYETLMILEQGFALEAFVNPLVSLLLGLLGVSLGWYLGAAL